MLAEVRDMTGLSRRCSSLRVLRLSLVATNDDGHVVVVVVVAGGDAGRRGGQDDRVRVVRGVRVTLVVDLLVVEPVVADFPDIDPGDTTSRVAPRATAVQPVVR